MTSFLSPNTLRTVQDELITVADYLRWTISTFEQSALTYGHGTDNSTDEALHLLGHSLALSLPIAIELWSGKLTTVEREHYLQQVALRVNDRMPLPYVTHTAWFRNRAYFVNRDVLIPRSPIGEVIEEILPTRFSSPPQKILDLGTGSGCLAITAAHQFPTSTVDAVDISEASLAVTETNVAGHQLQGKVFPLQSDGFAQLPSGTKYDLILSNPPYVPEESIEELPKEYQYEPKLALASGPSGFAMIDEIIAHAHHYLQPHGLLVLEVGENQRHFAARFPRLTPEWLLLPSGGIGICLLTASQLQYYHTTVA